MRLFALALLAAYAPVQRRVGRVGRVARVGRRRGQHVVEQVAELLLPETIESITIVRGGLQSARRTDTFSGYRRFLTAGRVKGR